MERKIILLTEEKLIKILTEDDYHWKIQLNREKNTAQLQVNSSGKSTRFLDNTE